MTTVDTLASDLGDELDASGDIAEVTGLAALRQRLLAALLTTQGTIPYFPDDGANAAASEGGPALDGGELGRRVRAQLARDPDVLAVGQVLVRPGAIAGTSLVSASVTTRQSPTSPQILNLSIPGA